MLETLINGLWADRFLVAGTLAGGLSIAAFWPYVRDTLRGSTRPDRACWLIWAVLASISGASNLYEGASGSLFFVGAQVLGTLVVFALSIRRGSGDFLSRSNVLILGAAGVGLVSWAVTETAVYALAIAIGVSALGGIATIWKAYQAPRTETMSSWGVLLVSAVVGTYSVGAPDGLLLAYPVYLVVLYSGIVAAQYAGHLRQTLEDEQAERAMRRMVMPPLRSVDVVVPLVSMPAAKAPEPRLAA